MSDTTTNPTPTPAVGQGATLVYPDDRYLFRITAVSKSGHKITMEWILTTGLKPDDYCNGFTVFDHIYTAEEIAAAPASKDIRHAYRNKDGKYRVGGSIPVIIGTARYRRNYAD